MFDEGIVLTSAMRISAGDLFHKDFYSNYGPAQYYIVSFIQQTFSDQFLGPRCYDIIVRAAVTTAVYIILRTQASPRTSLMFAAVCVLWMISIGYYLYPIFPCILLSLVGTYLLYSAQESASSTIRIVLSGSCTGLIFLFRYDVAAMVGTANVLSLLASRLIYRDHKWKERIVFDVTVYTISALLFTIPVLLLFISQEFRNGFYEDIIDYSKKYYAKNRGLPLPDLSVVLSFRPNAAVYIPILVCTVALYQSARNVTLRRISRTDEFVIWFGSLSAALFVKGLVRSSALHMLLSIIPATIVAAVLCERWWRSGSGWRTAAVALCAVTVAPPVRATLFELRQSIITPARSIAGWLLKVAPEVCREAPIASAARLPEYYSRTAYFLHRNAKGNNMLSALPRHDKIFANAPGIYFASGMYPPTRWHQFDPGMVTRIDVQARIISELQSGNVSWIIRDGTYSDYSEPNESAISSGVHILDEYMESHYRRVAWSGPLEIWLRSSEPFSPVLGPCDPDHS
jgi:hypothetical protein